jgi:hypothetical protein
MLGLFRRFNRVSFRNTIVGCVWFGSVQTSLNEIFALGFGD